MGGHVPDDPPAAPSSPPADDAGDDAPKPKKPKITMKEIANWDMGRLIRRQSNDCRDLILALYEMLHPPYVFPSANPDERKYQKATQIKPHHEFGALQELLKRGHGCQNPHSYAQTSAMEEKKLHEWLSRQTREIDNNGLGLVTALFHIVENRAHDARGNLITNPYTQTQRLWSIKHLIWRGVDIPWEHITPEMIDEYLRDLDEKERLETERKAAERKAAANAPLTPEKEASVLAMFDEMQRAMDAHDAKAAAKAEKKAQKAAKKADAAKKAELDAASAGNANGKNADTGANTDTPTDRGARAVSNALARHPEVDLDTALQNFPETANVPKDALTHDLIYRAIIAEANFQKRQAKFKNLPPTDGPEDGDPPKSRSP